MYSTVASQETSTNKSACKYEQTAAVRPSPTTLSIFADVQVSWLKLWSSYKQVIEKKCPTGSFCFNWIHVQGLPESFLPCLPLLFI